MLSDRQRFWCTKCGVWGADVTNRLDDSSIWASIGRDRDQRPFWRIYVAL